MYINVCCAGENHMVSLLSSLTTCKITPVNREECGRGGEGRWSWNSQGGLQGVEELDRVYN